MPIAAYNSCGIFICVGCERHNAILSVMVTGHISISPFLAAALTLRNMRKSRHTAAQMN